ncbi:MAG: hypothetical protein AB1481_02425, partial [Candidatus Omnitrophota bacterium]
MSYAKVVLAIPVSGPFDYIIPEKLRPALRIGARVKVDFRAKLSCGYVAGISKKSNIKQLKPVLELIDEAPILDNNLFSLARDISEYYYCSFGEAIAAILPQDLRKGKKVSVMLKEAE